MKPAEARRIRGLVAVALVTALASACATVFDRERDPLTDGPGVPIVRVINQNFYDVTVYTETDGHRERLGRVIGNTTQVFRLPDRFVGSTVAFAVAVQAGRTFTTRPMTVFGGEEIELRVPPDLDRR